MSLYDHTNKFRTMFHVMGCVPTKSNSVHPSPNLGVYCKQISVMPLLSRRHSKTSNDRHRKSSQSKSQVIVQHSFIDSRNRERELLSTYDKSHRDSKVQDKGRKVFLSQTQSGSISYLGEKRPCAPPVTPTPDYLKRVEYVPSMQDILAQRTLRGKLQDIEKAKKQHKDRVKAEMMKKEAEKKKEETNKLKVYQRSQIYALNAAMTDLEHQRFLMFQQQMSRHSSP